MLSGFLLRMCRWLDVFTQTRMQDCLPSRGELGTRAGRTPVGMATRGACRAPWREQGRGCLQERVSLTGSHREPSARRCVLGSRRRVPGSTLGPAGRLWNCWAAGQRRRCPEPGSLVPLSVARGLNRKLSPHSSAGSKPQTRVPAGPSSGGSLPGLWTASSSLSPQGRDSSGLVLVL